MADLITLTPVKALNRVYPHVANISDWETQQSIRLLWDRVWGFEERLQALETNTKQIAAALNTLSTNLAGVKQTAQLAYALAQEPGKTPQPPGPTPDCPDDGQCGAGVTTARSDPATYPNGDQGVVPHDALHAGYIIGGTANEYNALVQPTVDQPTRDANTVELLRRMIWHLNQAGFIAGRQKNPSGVISGDKLTVGIGGTTYAFDVFAGVNFTVELPVKANRVCPDSYVADPGIAD